MFGEVDALAFIIKEAMRIFRPSDCLDLDTRDMIRREGGEGVLQSRRLLVF